VPSSSAGYWDRLANQWFARLPTGTVTVSYSANIYRIGPDPEVCARICGTMKPDFVSRRSFIATGTAALATQFARAVPNNHVLTAGEVVERIRAHVGMPWLSDAMQTTVDNLVAGENGTTVHSECHEGA
jgi:hypothetical protein